MRNGWIFHILFEPAKMAFMVYTLTYTNKESFCLCRKKIKYCITMTWNTGIAAFREGYFEIFA